MDIYAQHGYGKSDKLELGLRQGTIKGVILSPRDEQPQRMETLISDLREEFGDSIVILFDPQFYAATVSEARDGYLPEYDYYESGLSRRSFLAAADIQKYARGALSYQARLSLTYMIAPTIVLQDFGGSWGQIALTLANESVEQHAALTTPPPLLLSLVVDESALRSRDRLTEFLDIISVWDVEGFYLVVRLNDLAYPAFIEAEVLENLIYLVYVLSAVNEFRVICGYTDLVGTILHAVGAEATASGWHNSLRQFSLARFEPARRGGAARPRYTSEPLMNSLVVIPELEAIFQNGYGAQVLSGTAYDAVMSRGPANAVSGWTTAVSCLHHWEVLNSMAKQFTSTDSVGANLDMLDQAIQASELLYRRVAPSGFRFEPASGPRNLASWRRAIQSFRSEVKI